MPTPEQITTCARVRSPIEAPLPGERIGIAIETLGQQPLNALRIQPDGAVSGWYIWCGGEPSLDPEFYQPLCVEHLAEYVPELVPYLALAPGWRVLLAAGYEDVWFDQALLETDA